MTPQFLLYLGGVYVDLLVATVGGDPAWRAQAALDEAGGIRNVLPAVVGGRAEEAAAEEARRAMEAAAAQVKDAGPDGSV